MAHFAKVHNDVVEQVIVVNNTDCGGGVFPESESVGQAFIASLGLDGVWLQTSYNNNFCGSYAGTGSTWNGTDFIQHEIHIPTDIGIEE